MRVLFPALLVAVALVGFSLPAGAQSNNSSIDIQVFNPLNATTGSSHLRADLHVGMGWKEGAAPSHYPAVGFSPYTGLWTPLHTGSQQTLDFGILGRVAAMVGNDHNIWVYIPQTSNWAVESFTQVDGFDIGGSVALAWCDGEKAIAHSTFLSMKSLQPLAGSNFQSSVDDDLHTTAALLFNDTDAYGYSSLTNSWGHQALDGAVEGHSPGENCGLVWTGDTRYGYSSAYSNFFGSPAGSEPLAGVAGNKVAVSYSTDEAALFDGLNGQWIAGPVYNQNYPPFVRVDDESALIWADSGAWAFDLYAGVWYDTGIVPGYQAAFLGDIHDNSILLWNNNQAWGYRRAAPFVPGEHLTLDGTPVVGHVNAGGSLLVNANNAYGMGHDCTWVAQPLDSNKTYRSDMGFDVAAVWCDDEAYAFNTRTNAWTQITLTNASGYKVECSSRHVIVWNGTEAKAYDVFTDSVYSQAINGTLLAGAHTIWTSAVFADSLTAYVFSSETAVWSEMTVDGWPKFINMGGYDLIIVTNTTGYGYTSLLGTWASTPMTAALKGYMGVTLGMVYTPSELWGFSAYTGTWTNQPL